MDHAEVLQRIEAAVASPGGLARLGADPSPTAADLRAHVNRCANCAAEWRAWSVVSLGLAAAAPDTLEPRPELREQVLVAAAAHPHSLSTTLIAPGRPSATPSRGAPTSSSPASGATRSGIAPGPRRPRSGAPGAAAATMRSGPSFRWLLLGAAAVVVLFVAGMILGRQLAATPVTPRGDPARVLAEAATILQGGGFGLARLERPDGQPGGVVVVSPGSGRLAVVSSALGAPPDGTRYVCLLDRDGTVTQVGYMRWEPTSDGGGLAYWAGAAEPADLGLQGDRFIVRLDLPGAQPVLSGEFQG